MEIRKKDILKKNLMNILRENLELKLKIKILESKLQNQTSNDDSYNLLFRIGESFLLGTFPKAFSQGRLPKTERCG